MKKLILAMLLGFWSILPAVMAKDTLLTGEILGPNASLQSPNGKYTLIMQSDGSLVMYRWDGSIRYRMAKYGSYAVLHPNGQFWEINSAGQVIWSSNSPITNIIMWLQIYDDGNLGINYPGPLYGFSWQIGSDTGGLEPTKIGDVLGRTLASTGAGVAGHLAVFDGSQLYEAEPGMANAVHLNSISGFKNTTPSTTFWGVASPNIAPGQVYACFQTTCNGVSVTGFETTTTRVAIAKWLRQQYLIGADYTVTVGWRAAMPASYPLGPKRGLFRCDTLAVAAMLASITTATVKSPEQSLWQSRAEGLTAGPIYPDYIWGKLREFY